MDETPPESPVELPPTPTEVSRRGLLSLAGLGAGAAVTAATLHACAGDDAVGERRAALEGSRVDVLQTVADLREQLPGADSPEVWRVLGYHAPNDGGGGLFHWDEASSAPENHGTVIVPAAGPSIGRWMRVFNGVFNVQHFGARSDNDDTGEVTTHGIRAAFEAAEAAPNTNHVVYFPTGVYRYNGGATPIRLRQGTQILGDGSAASRILFGSESESCNFVQYVRDGRPGWSVRHLGFRSDSTRVTGGDIIEVSSQGGQDAVIEDLNLRSSGTRGSYTAFWNVIRINAAAQNITIRDVVIAAKFSVAFLFDDCLNIHLSHFLVDGLGARNVPVSGTGLRMRGHEGQTGIEAVFCESGIFANCARALHVTGHGDPPVRLSGGVTNCKFAHVMFDDAQEADGALLDKMANSWFTDCYFVSAARFGCHVSSSNHIYFHGCQFDKNVEHGLRIASSASSVYVVGGSAKDNNDAGDQRAAGIQVDDGVAGFVINGVDCKSNSSVYGNRQELGVSIGEGCSAFSVTSCDLRGNPTALENRSGTGNNRFAHQNLT